MPQVDRGDVKARAAQLRAAVATRRDNWLQSLVGETLPVLAERDGTGYAPNYARVRLPQGTPAGRVTPFTPTSLDQGFLS